MKGRFFVIEGLDGAGKSTVIREVKKQLLGFGVSSKKVLVTAEPTQSLFGQELRKMLGEGKNPLLGGEEFLALYVLDRKHHLKSEILPAIHAGKIVLCDRYKYSTLVYQSLQGLGSRKIVSMHWGMAVPDSVFVLDVPIETALERLSLSGRKKKEVFEKKAFLKKARKKFLELNKFFPKEKIIVFDASKSAKAVSQKIFAQMKKFL